MTVEEVKKYARENYNNGGDVIVECWEDEEIREFLRNNSNPKKALDKIFCVRNEEFEAVKYFSGYNHDAENGLMPDENEDEESGYEEDEDDKNYIRSATLYDYSPSSPWNAPGMSIRDFI